jgi:hypothetical protein
VHVVLLAVCFGACGPSMLNVGFKRDDAGVDTGPDASGPCTPTSCGDLQYCSTCGAHAGQCVWHPQDCIYQPGPVVCGCDGTLYMTSCDAELNRVDIDSMSHCPAPPGTFRCGTLFCTHGTQYCETWFTNDIGDPPYVLRYACADLPNECGATPTCTCVTRSECADCTMSADGDVIAMCLQSI